MIWKFQVRYVGRLQEQVHCILFWHVTRSISLEHRFYFQINKINEKKSNAFLPNNVQIVLHAF
jgi:hypothetical protein